MNEFDRLAADKIAACVDVLVQSGRIDARSKLADLRLDYGEPFTRARCTELLDGYEPGTALDSPGREIDALARARSLERELHRLTAVLNRPVIRDFLEGVRIEAAHQRERWGESHDLRKEPEDFFWVLGWLSGKIVHSLRAGERDKALHHTISSAALLANWHALIAHAEKET